jgi:hypothetical protein
VLKAGKEPALFGNSAAADKNFVKRMGEDAKESPMIPLICCAEKMRHYNGRQ